MLTFVLKQCVIYLYCIFMVSLLSYLDYDYCMCYEWISMVYFMLHVTRYMLFYI